MVEVMVAPLLTAVAVMGILAVYLAEVRGAGVVTTALSQETGAKIWQFGYTCPSPPRG